MNLFKYALLPLILAASTSAHAQNIQLQFSGIRSTRGQVIVKVFETDKAFEDDKPTRTIKFPKKGILNGNMSGALSLDAGTYGLALLDDENSNTKMEYNIVGMPKEGFGFSDFYLTGLKKPKFEQFKFTLTPNQSRNITMKIRYL